MAQGSAVFEAATEYWRDAAQRGVLFMETLNERGNTYVAQSAKTVPHVLTFPVEILRGGRTLERPANYALVRIVPPDGVAIDPLKPLIVVVDPRAGHGPGIGGMKPESEIGVALRAGHPVYFVGFLPKPEPGQTIEDVCHAEGTFIENVAQRHPESRTASSPPWITSIATPSYNVLRFRKGRNHRRSCGLLGGERWIRTRGISRRIANRAVRDSRTTKIGHSDFGPGDGSAFAMRCPRCRAFPHCRTPRLDPVTAARRQGRVLATAT